MPVMNIEINGASVDGFLSSIDLPLMPGGPAIANITVFKKALNFSDIVLIKEGLNLRFEGEIHDFTKTKNTLRPDGNEVSAKVYCKPYIEALKQNFDIIDFNGTGEDFRGNGVEHNEWLYKDNPNLHPYYPLVGIDVAVFDDQSVSVVVENNIKSISEVRKNNLPSHVKAIVKKYREGRYPVKSGFDENLKVEPHLLNSHPLFRNYGRRFIIHDPATPANAYTAKILTNPSIGACKFSVKGKADASEGNEHLKGDYSLSATINPRRVKKVLKKVGEAAPGSGSGADDIGIKNFCMVQMKFLSGSLLPRVKGDFGVAENQQECFVRARVLEEIDHKTTAIGGINSQDLIAEYEHVEIDVAFDYFDGNTYQDQTFGGQEGLLGPDDKGEGIWSSDLTGSYIEKDGIEKANDHLAKAFSHYAVLKFSNNVELQGIDWNINPKIKIDGNDIILSSINWSFDHVENLANSTKYNGIRLKQGFSLALLRKKLHFKRTKKEKEEKEESNKQTEDKQGETIQNTRMFARIAWIVNNAKDISEGELVKPSGETFIATNQRVWISYTASVGVTFETGGDNTIFEVELLRAKHTREGTELPLYKANKVIADLGRRITHLQVIEKDPLIIAHVLTTVGMGVGKNIYHEAEGGTGNAVFISTLVTGTRHVWKIEVKIADEWNLLGVGDFKYLKNPGSTRFPFLCVPVEPVKKEAVNEKEFESNKKKVDTITPIATYTRK